MEDGSPGSDAYVTLSGDCDWILFEVEGGEVWAPMNITDVPQDPDIMDQIHQEHVNLHGVPGHAMCVRYGVKAAHIVGKTQPKIIGVWVRKK